jgi:hypothetical protein
MTGFNGRDLASRVAGLLQGKFKGDLVAAARELDVDPDQLREIVDDQTEQPHLEVLSRLVAYFGVDVCWLLTGEYDWQAHMRLLADDDERDVRDGQRDLLQRLAEEHLPRRRETAGGRPGAGRHAREA